MAPEGASQRRRVCFVTIGATAGFNALIAACLEGHFLEALVSANYTDLLIQYGKEGRPIYEKAVSDAARMLQYGLTLQGFDFNQKGLEKEMRSAKGESGSVEGVIISHAGSGSILHALRIGVPLIVVPNPDLLDNHQIELAEALEKQGYVVHGQLDNLPAAIVKSEELRKTHKEWPPVNSGQHRRAGALPGVLDEEMGFLD